MPEINHVTKCENCIYFTTILESSLYGCEGFCGGDMIPCCLKGESLSPQPIIEEYAINCQYYCLWSL